MPGPPVTHVLYLHGFRSSPQSAKAQRLRQHLAQHAPQVHWCAPQLPASPREAVALCHEQVRRWPLGGGARSTVMVLGSSLGGFYATALAADWQVRCGLLNPAVRPERDLARYIGEQTAWHDPAQRLFFDAAYIDELAALQRPGRPSMDCVHALITQGDEVLDWREMAGRYPGADVCVLPGGDHAISDFEDHLERVMAWLGLATSDPSATK
jgi:uncharacterized protein